jgi:queuosine precursor transporter
MERQDLMTAVGDTWHPKLLPYFALSMMALMLITNILNLKFINVAGFSIIASQIPYVLSLVLADVMAEVYGYRRVRRLLYLGLGALVFFAVCLQLAVIAPPAMDYPNNDAFRTIFAQTPRIVAASIVAYFVTELTNSYVMSNLKIRFRANYFYGRAIASVGVAQLVNGITFFAIAFAGIMPITLIASAAAFSWIITMITEVVVLPLTKQLAQAVKRHEGVEHFDRPPAGDLAPV